MDEPRDSNICFHTERVVLMDRTDKKRQLLEKKMFHHFKKHSIRTHKTLPFFKYQFFIYLT